MRRGGIAGFGTGAICPREILITDVGPIIGAHTGPGLMALFFVAEKR